MNILHSRHSRDWRRNIYVYPVLSRRSRGISIGINLNPDTACNFDCVYCQVDRTQPPRVREVDLAVLRVELESMVDEVIGGGLWRTDEFRVVPESLRHLHDLAFSGDGEPTSYPHFADAVSIAVDLLNARPLDDVELVLITDACYLTRPEVMRGLATMDTRLSAIWAKLDAGTEEYYRLINRPNYPLRHVMDNIIHASRIRPVVIQSIWMRVHGSPPPSAEIAAFVERLQEILDAGGAISLVQVYTLARPPTESWVTPLDVAEVDEIADRVRRGTGLRAEPFYSTWTLS